MRFRHSPAGHEVESWARGFFLRSFPSNQGLDQKFFNDNFADVIQFDTIVKSPRNDGPKILSVSSLMCIIESAEALPLLCVRCARWEKEREREIQRRKWRHLSSAEIGDEFQVAPFLAKICTLAKSFALFLAKNLHLSFSPLEGRWVHTFRCQKRCALRNSSRSSFCFCQMAWQGIKARNKRSNFRLHRPSSHRKNESN